MFKILLVAVFFLHAGDCISRRQLWSREFLDTCFNCTRNYNRMFAVVGLTEGKEMDALCLNLENFILMGEEAAVNISRIVCNPNNCNDFHLEFRWQIWHYGCAQKMLFPGYAEKIFSVYRKGYFQKEIDTIKKARAMFINEGDRNRTAPLISVFNFIIAPFQFY